MEGLYLYGIVGIPPELSREIRGLGGNPVRLLPRGEVAAVVSRSPLRPWSVDEAHLTLHEAVVEDVMSSRPILPVRFNTILRTEKAVFSLLEGRTRVFRSALGRVEGKVEVGLRVLWEPPEEGELSEDEQGGGRGPGTQYLFGKLEAERRRARFRAAGEQLIQGVQTFFHSLAVERWVHRFPAHRLLLSGAYLVEEDRVAAFRESATQAGKKFPRLHFLVTGPWPPYHFVNGTSDETPDILDA